MGSGLMLYAVAAAAVVIIIIALMVFRKKSKEAKAKKPDNSKATMGFANPVYDSDVANPTYDGGENYVDPSFLSPRSMGVTLPEKEADAGYLDVDNVDEEAAY